MQGRYPDCDYTKMWLIHVIIHVVGHAGQASSTSDAGGHGGPWRQDSCHLNSAVPTAVRGVFADFAPVFAPLFDVASFQVPV